MNISSPSHPFLARNSQTDYTALQHEMLKAGVLHIHCGLGDIPQKLHEIKSLRFLSPAGTPITLVIDHDIAINKDEEWIAALLNDRHFAGLTIESDVEVLILSHPKGIESLRGNFKKLAQKNKTRAIYSSQEPGL